MSIYGEFVTRTKQKYPDVIIPRKVLNEMRFHRALVYGRSMFKKGIILIIHFQLLSMYTYRNGKLNLQNTAGS